MQTQEVLFSLWRGRPGGGGHDFSHSFGTLFTSLGDRCLIKEATILGAVWNGFRDLFAAPSETSPSSNFSFLVLFILKEQQLDQFSQEQAKSLQQKHLRLEKEEPFQTDLCMLSVPSHPGANHVYPRTLALSQHVTIVMPAVTSTKC